MWINGEQYSERDLMRMRRFQRITKVINFSIMVLVAYVIIQFITYTP
jgi:hypothetical protein